MKYMDNLDMAQWFYGFYQSKEIHKPQERRSSLEKQNFHGQTEKSAPRKSEANKSLSFPKPDYEKEHS